MNSVVQPQSRVRRRRTLGQKWHLISLPNKLMVIATIVIAAATVVNVSVSRAMWKEMHAGGADTHDLAQAAVKQADAMELEERAWIGVTEVQTPTELHEGTLLNPTISLVNSGKTPAFNVVQRVGYRIVHAGNAFDPGREASLSTPVRQGIILPNGKRMLSVSDLGNIGRQRAIELNGGAYRLYLFGEITYDDAFHHTHRTRFCMRMELGKRLAFAPYGSYDYAD